MTRTSNSKFLSIKQLLVFILAMLMCLSLFMATACKKDDDDSADDIPEYSYSDNTDSEIKNPSFTFGTQSLQYDDYPKTTIDGWSFTKVATSKSGVVDTSEAGWAELMPNLYKDDGLLSYVKHVNDIDDSKIKEIIREKEGDPNKAVTSSEIKQFIIDNYFLVPETKDPNTVYAFENPGTHADDLDNKVYMLNNYVKNDLNYGCIQTLTSSNEITLNRGEYAKVSVWVKTANLNTDKTENRFGEAIGANVRVKNSFNGTEQTNYGIYNITNTDWQQYTFYLRADDVYETKFTLQLGLGYDKFATTGTVYFDDVQVELLDEISDTYQNTNTINLSYNDEDAESIVKASNYSAETAYIYDMRLNLTDTEFDEYSEIVDFESDTTNLNYYDFTQYKGGNKDGNFTMSSVKDAISITNKNDLDAPYGLTNGLEIKIKKPSSYAIKLYNEGKPFELEGESYSAITFFVKNQLNKFYATDITINVEDKYGNEIEERAAVATISNVSDEWEKYTIIVKNNFDEDKYDTAREFYLEIVIGPDVEKYNSDDYAFGTVTISSPIVSTGKTYQYVDETNETETPFYQYYKLLSDTSEGSTSLYTGFNEDYSADEADSEKYSLVVAPSNIGQILDNPATPQAYTGIEAEHYYITGNQEDSIKINNNPYAGLVNTQYLDKYKTDSNLSNISDALVNYETDKNIQPLMIKTNDKSYGFISESYTVPTQSYAKVSLKVSVYNATAYIYLVDTSKKEKQVLKLDSFTVNTNKGEFNNEGQVINKELFFEINDEMLDDNRWVTVEFYIATGATEKEFRIELWNGSRDNTDNLTNNGYVFFNDIEVETSNAFEEPANWQNALTKEGTPLYNHYIDLTNATDTTDLILFERELSSLEKQYNNENSNKISYNPTYVWAKTDTLIYAIYNTIDPIEVDPYASDVEDDVATGDKSLYESDPAAFWLSLSSIIIGVALIVAIIMLFIKNIRRRRKANKSDAKSHYTVRSRTKKSTKPVEEVDIDIDIDIDEPTTNEENSDEKSLDSYVYSDVQVFGEEESDSEQDDENN